MVKCMMCKERDGTIELRYARLVLCEDCFIEYFIKRIKKTVEEYQMFKPDDRVAVAVSGGKDSIALLYGLREAYPDLDLHAIHIDLGIEGFSEKAREAVEKVVDMLGIPVHIYPLKGEKGYTIQDFIGTKYGRRICATCSIIKRYYLSYIASKINADVLATGHVLDDVVEVMFTLFVDGKFEDLISQKPVLEPKFPNQVRKVKPLIKTYEWETKLYVELKKLPILDIECPLKIGARSPRRKEILRRFEEQEPAFMRRLYRVFVKKLIPMLEKEVEEVRLQSCKICGGPSLTGICSKCKMEVYLKDIKNLDIKIG